MLKENITKWRQVETCYYELIHAYGENHDEINSIIKKISTEFDDSLENDFNTHLALLTFFQLIKETNRLAADEKLGIGDSLIIKKEFERMLFILGLSIPEMTEDKKREIDDLVSNREKLRNEKQFDEADRIRDKLNGMNIELIDHKEKTIWMRKENIKAEN
jgi:cysteinyl-tRNA synthetase